MPATDNDTIDPIDEAPAIDDGVRRDADGNEIIDLIEPVKVTLKRAGQEAREEVFKELTFHTFKAKDMRAIDGLGENAGSIILALIARMTRQPVKVIDELGAKDFAVLAGKVQAFLPTGLTTGQTA